MLAMSPEKERVHDEICRVGPLEAFRRLIAENDLLIRSPEMDNGRAIVRARA